MKNWLLSVVVLAASGSAFSEQKWEQVPGQYSAPTGSQVFVPLPAALQYDFRFQAYIASAPFVTSFMVRLDPGSVERQCRLATNNEGDIQATSVVSSQPNLSPTLFLREERSVRRPGAVNKIFAVNAEFGAPVQAITVAFKKGGVNATTCFFEILYTRDPADGPQLQAAAAPASVESEDPNKPAVLPAGSTILQKQETTKQ